VPSLAAPAEHARSAPCSHHFVFSCLFFIYVSRFCFRFGCCVCLCVCLYCFYLLVSCVVMALGVLDVYFSDFSFPILRRRWYRSAGLFRLLMFDMWCLISYFRCPTSLLIHDADFFDV
jgi:hypothetical protein